MDIQELNLDENLKNFNFQIDFKHFFQNLSNKFELLTTKGLKNKEKEERIKVISNFEQTKEADKIFKNAIIYQESPFELDDTKQKELNEYISEKGKSDKNDNFEDYFIKEVFLKDLSNFFQEYDIVSLNNIKFSLLKNDSKNSKIEVFKVLVKIYTNWIYSCNVKNYTNYDDLFIHQIFISFPNNLENAIHILLWEDCFQSDNLVDYDEEELKEVNILSNRYDTLIDSVFNLIENEKLYFSKSKIFNFVHWKKLHSRIPFINQRLIENISNTLNDMIQFYIEESNDFIAENTKILFFSSLFDVIESLFNKKLDIKLQNKIIFLYMKLVEISEIKNFLIKPVNQSLSNVYFYLNTANKEIMIDFLKQNFKKINNKDYIQLEKLENEEMMNHKSKIDQGIIQAKLLPYINFCLYADNSAITHLPEVLKGEYDVVREFILDVLFTKMKIHSYLCFESIIQMVDKADEKNKDLILFLIKNSEIIKKISLTEHNAEIYNSNIIKEKENQMLLKKQIIEYIEKSPDTLCQLFEYLGMKMNLYEFFDWYLPYLKNSVLFNNPYFLKACKEMFKRINSKLSDSYLVDQSLSELNIKDGIVYLIYYLVVNYNSSTSYIENRLILWSQYKSQERRSFSKSIKQLLLALISKVDYNVLFDFMNFCYDDNYKNVFCEVLQEYIKLNEGLIEKTEALLNSISFMIISLKPFSSKLLKNLSDKMRSKIKSSQTIFSNK